MKKAPVFDQKTGIFYMFVKAGGKFVNILHNLCILETIFVLMIEAYKY